MDVQISLETTFDDGTRRTHRLGGLSRSCKKTSAEALGLLLHDAKAILSEIQKASRHQSRCSGRETDRNSPTNRSVTPRSCPLPAIAERLLCWYSVGAP